MFELKTVLRKADHPLLTLPEAVEAAPSREPRESKETNQRRLMIVALALLLLALGVILYKDRDFWFPDTQEADDQLEPVPVTATPSHPTAKTAAPVDAKGATAKEKVFTGISRPPKVPVPAKSEPVADNPAPPMTASATRTVLPPLEVEVVAGDNHKQVHPGSNSVRVDLQTGSPPRPVANASANPPASAASVTSQASERVQMSAGTADVVSQPVSPGYPMLARQMRVQGSVILQALIGRDGTIQSLHVLSGPPILAQAAQDAVRQWRFKPHFVANEAVETQANITVNFTISTN
jgi:protein TonB